MFPCPFCPNPTEFPSEDELIHHIVQIHPEKLQTAEAYGQAMAKAMRQQQVSQIAAQLTSIVIGRDGAPVEQVLATYRDIYQKIGEWV